MFIDNINKRLDSGPLASAITARRMRQRLLGVSRTQTVSIKCLWAATGNNVRMSREMVRRTIPASLLPESERPYEGRTFKRELPAWAIENRPRLAAAALTLIRAWLVAGKPKGHRSLGMFEAWAKTMGGILDVAGIPGFLSNLDTFRRSAVDTEGDWRAFAGLWWERFKDTPVTVSDLYDVAAGAELLGAVPDPVAEGRPDRRANRGLKTKFGIELAKARNRVYGPYRIVHDGEDRASKAARYRLCRLAGAAPETPFTTTGDTIEFTDG